MASRASQGACEGALDHQVWLQAELPGEQEDPGASSWIGPLRAALLRWLSRRLWDTHLAEDIASETVLRAWQEFGETDVGPRSWGWAVCVARNLLSNHRACAFQRRCALGCDFEAIAARPGVDGLEFRAMVEALGERLAADERVTFGILAAGVHATSGIAALRGVSPRCVRASRARIRTAAHLLWNVS